MELLGRGCYGCTKLTGGWTSSWKRDPGIYIYVIYIVEKSSIQIFLGLCSHPSCLFSAMKALPGPTGAAVDADVEQQVAARGSNHSNHRDLQPLDRGRNVPGWLWAECTAQQAC